MQTLVIVLLIVVIMLYATKEIILIPESYKNDCAKIFGDDYDL